MIKNIFYMGFTTGLRIIINAALLIAMARSLQTDQYGFFATSTAICLVSTVLIEFGYNTYLIKTIAEDRDRVNETMMKSSLMKVYLIPCYLLLCIILYGILLHNNYFFEFLIIMIYTLLMSLSDFLNVAFRSISKFKIETKVSTISSIIHIILMLPICMATDNLAIILSGMFFCKLLLLLNSAINYKKEFNNLPIPKILTNNYAELKCELSRVKYFAIDSMIVNIRANIDVILVRIFLGLESVAVYQIGMNLAKTLERPGPVLASVYLPKLSKNNNNFKGYVLQFSFLMFLISVMLSTLMLNIDMSIIFGQKYSSLNEVMGLLMVYVSIRYCCMVFGVLMTVLNLQKYRAFIGVFNLIFLLSIFHQFTKYYAVNGAIYSMITSSLMLMISFIFCIYYKKLKNKKRFR